MLFGWLCARTLPAQISLWQMHISACTQIMVREPSFFFQCSCSQNDEFFAFSSRSAPSHFNTLRTPDSTHQNVANGLRMAANLCSQVASRPVSHLKSTRRAASAYASASSCKETYLSSGLPFGTPLDKYAANRWLDPDPHREGIQTKQYGANLQ